MLKNCTLVIINTTPAALYSCTFQPYCQVISHLTMEAAAVSRRFF
jgi:hypothetical protein